MTTDPSRIAVIEIGSRAVRLLIADVSDQLAEVGAATERTELASALRQAGDELVVAITKVNDAVARFVERGRRQGAEVILVFGTAAVRALSAQSKQLPFDFDVEVLSPNLEARCSLIAAVKSLGSRIGDGQSVVAVDLGAGSVEFATGTATRGDVRLDTMQSLPLGTDLLGVEFRKLDRNIRKFYISVTQRLGDESLTFANNGTLVAMGSAATKLGWLREAVTRNAGRVTGVYDRSKAHGQEITRGNIGSLLYAATKNAETVRELLDRRIDDYSEFDAIIPGCVLLDHVLIRLGFKSFVVSAWGTRHGLAWLWPRLEATPRE